MMCQPYPFSRAISQYSVTVPSSIFCGRLSEYYNRFGSVTRAGVIPYCIEDGKIYLCLGVDTVYDEYTDFGGTVKEGELACEAALRELKEESLGVFGKSINNVTDIFASSHFVCDGETLILFNKVSKRMRSVAVEDFNRAFTSYRGNKKLEVKEIRWIPVPDFVRLLIDDTDFLGTEPSSDDSTSYGESPSMDSDSMSSSGSPPSVPFLSLGPSAIPSVSNSYLHTPIYSKVRNLLQLIDINKLIK